MKLSEIKGNRFKVYPSSRFYDIIDKGDTATKKEALAVIRADMARARAHFGTACLHCWETFQDGRYVLRITARKDEQSALWIDWIMEGF